MAGLDANPGGGAGRESRGSLRRDAVVRRIAGAWRDLTGGRSRGVDDRERRTLVACSGGADSSALSIALAQVTQEIVIGHVVHDLRVPDAVERDRDAAARLAALLGAEFSFERIGPGAAGGNSEGTARGLRYQALEAMARERRCGYVATGHHAGDELETLLMGLVRGAGPRGLGGVRPSRPLSDGVTLVRPMLGVGREDAERVCRAFGWAWVDDETNQDEARLRACLRKNVAPLLECVRPGAASRASRSAALIREAGEIVAEAADELMAAADPAGRGLSWRGEALRGRRMIVLGELLRSAIARVGGEGGLDRVGGVTIDAVVSALQETGADRSFTLRSVLVRVRDGGLEVVPRTVDCE